MIHILHRTLHKPLKCDQNDKLRKLLHFRYPQNDDFDLVPGTELRIGFQRMALRNLAQLVRFLDYDFSNDVHQRI